MKMKPSTEKKLEHSVGMLIREFDTFEPDEIADEVQGYADLLLQEAHFDDYVPLLAHRHARQRLHEQLEAAAFN